MDRWIINGSCQGRQGRTKGILGGGGEVSKGLRGVGKKQKGGRETGGGLSLA